MLPVVGMSWTLGFELVNRLAPRPAYGLRMEHGFPLGSPELAPTDTTLPEN